MSSMPPKRYISRHVNINGVNLGNKKSGVAGGVGTGSNMNRLYRSKARVSLEDRGTIFHIDPNAGGIGRGRGVFGGSGFPKMDGNSRAAHQSIKPTPPAVTPAPVAITTPLVSALTTDHDYWGGLFSLKLLASDYEGPVITLRRESDNTRMAFYSTASGVLTSEADGSGTTVAAFLTNTTGFVDTWHDQSGNGNDAGQSIFTLQPTIDLTNNCLDFGFNNGRSGLFLQMPSGTVPVGALNAPYSYVVKHGNSRNTATGGLIGAGSGAANASNMFNFNNNSLGTYNNYWVGNDFKFIVNDVSIPAVVAVTYNGVTLEERAYRSGKLSFTATNRKGSTTVARTQTIGFVPWLTPAGALNGQLYSVLIFSTELPQSDITILNGL